MENERHQQPPLQPIASNQLLALLIPVAFIVGVMLAYWILEENLPLVWRLGLIIGVLTTLLVLAFVLRAYYGKGALFSSYVFQSCLGLCLVFLASTDYYRKDATGGIGLLLFNYALGLLAGAGMTYWTRRGKEEIIARRKGMPVKAIYDFVQLWLAVTFAGMFLALNVYGPSGAAPMFPLFAAWQLSMGLFGMAWVYRYEKRTGIRIA